MGGGAELVVEFEGAITLLVLRERRLGIEAVTGLGSLTRSAPEFTLLRSTLETIMLLVEIGLGVGRRAIRGAAAGERTLERMAVTRAGLAKPAR